MQRPHRWTSCWRVIVPVALLGLMVAAFQPMAAAQDEESITIPLKEYKNSGVSGTATLTASSVDTRVSMLLSGDPVTGNHPTHIHTGTCDNFDPNPTYPLTTVILNEVSEVGTSDTTVEGVRLQDLLRSDFVILVHKSAEELTNYYVCGDIKASASVRDSPRTGVGVDVRIGSSTAPAVLGALAVISASLGGTLLHHRRKRG